MRLTVFFFFSSRRRHTRFDCDWSSDVCSSDLSPLPTLKRRVPPATPPSPHCWESAFRSEEHTSELQSQSNLVCRLLLEKKKKTQLQDVTSTYPTPIYQCWCETQRQ